uniref:Large ribosomal subunit protein uL11 C-terminal domain-containing protein n=1 Tax=Picocystis salinarum TaxID=88271 RepID=A0A6U9RML6_9CHLO|mmetsp:Transcript_2336/g.15632  ORF Transcript_2336/g.15632 Transcript_2336/m.15632 type:complete len:104 (+) Transcript_2336:541-852(+)
MHPSYRDADEQRTAASRRLKGLTVHRCFMDLQEKNVPHNGNITMEDIYEVARIMRERSMAKNFKGTVKEMLGTAVSVGCTVDKKDPREIQAAIDEGEIDVPEE